MGVLEGVWDVSWVAVVLLGVSFGRIWTLMALGGCCQMCVSRLFLGYIRVPIQGKTGRIGWELVFGFPWTWVKGITMVDKPIFAISKTDFPDLTPPGSLRVFFDPVSEINP